VNKVNYRQTSIIIDRFGAESAAYADSANNAGDTEQLAVVGVDNASDLAAVLAPRGRVAGEMATRDETQSPRLDYTSSCLTRLIALRNCVIDVKRLLGSASMHFMIAASSVGFTFG
jgi:hypothetical protein